jgi:hypothetical protein
MVMPSLIGTALGGTVSNHESAVGNLGRSRAATTIGRLTRHEQEQAMAKKSRKKKARKKSAANHGKRPNS